MRGLRAQCLLNSGDLCRPERSLTHLKPVATVWPWKGRAARELQELQENWNWVECEMNTSEGMAVVTSGIDGPWKTVDAAPEKSYSHAEMIKTHSRTEELNPYLIRDFWIASFNNGGSVCPSEHWVLSKALYFGTCSGAVRTYEQITLAR